MIELLNQEGTVIATVASTSDFPGALDWASHRDYNIVSWRETEGPYALYGARPLFCTWNSGGDPGNPGCEELVTGRPGDLCERHDQLFVHLLTEASEDEVERYLPGVIHGEGR